LNQFCNWKLYQSWQIRQNVEQHGYFYIFHVYYVWTCIISCNSNWFQKLFRKHITFIIYVYSQPFSSKTTALSTVLLYSDSDILSNTFYKIWLMVAKKMLYRFYLNVFIYTLFAFLIPIRLILRIEYTEAGIRAIRDVARCCTV
jgi:hypothetical protein